MDLIKRASNEGNSSKEKYSIPAWVFIEQKNKDFFTVKNIFQNDHYRLVFNV